MNSVCYSVHLNVAACFTTICFMHFKMKAYPHERSPAAAAVVVVAVDIFFLFFFLLWFPSSTPFHLIHDILKVDASSFGHFCFFIMVASCVYSSVGRSFAENAKIFLCYLYYNKNIHRKFLLSSAYNGNSAVHMDS